MFSKVVEFEGKGPIKVQGWSYISSRNAPSRTVGMTSVEREDTYLLCQGLRDLEVVRT
jgi:hypothetical protein